MEVAEEVGGEPPAEPTPPPRRATTTTTMSPPKSLKWVDLMLMRRDAPPDAVDVPAQDKVKSLPSGPRTHGPVHAKPSSYSLKGTQQCSNMVREGGEAVTSHTSSSMLCAHNARAEAL